jgi:hypothetical protein
LFLSILPPLSQGSASKQSLFRQLPHGLLAVAEQPFGSSRKPPTNVNRTANNDVSPPQQRYITSPSWLRLVMIQPASHISGCKRGALQSYEKAGKLPHFK